MPLCKARRGLKGIGVLVSASYLHSTFWHNCDASVSFCMVCSTSHIYIPACFPKSFWVLYNFFLYNRFSSKIPCFLLILNMYDFSFDLRIRLMNIILLTKMTKVLSTGWNSATSYLRYCCVVWVFFLLRFSLLNSSWKLMSQSNDTFSL